MLGVNPSAIIILIETFEATMFEPFNHAEIVKRQLSLAYIRRYSITRRPLPEWRLESPVVLGSNGSAAAIGNYNMLYYAGCCLAIKGQAGGLGFLMKSALSGRLGHPEGTVLESMGLSGELMKAAAGCVKNPVEGSTGRRQCFDS